MPDPDHRPWSHVAKPKSFDRKDYTTFLCSVKIYLAANDTKFRTYKSKILFVLSYMTEGHAGAWAQNFTDEAFDREDWGT